LLPQAGDAQLHRRPIRKNPARPRRGINDRYPLKMPRRHSVDAHCFGADRRPHLTDDDGARCATANQAGSGEGRCTNPEKFHTKLTSCRTAKLRFNVVAAAVGRLWYGEPNAVSNAIGYAMHYSRSHHAVIRVYDAAGNVIEVHRHKGEFTEARSVLIAAKVFSRLLQEIGLQRRSKAQLMNSF
jgi:hypothetical protein